MERVLLNIDPLIPFRRRKLERTLWQNQYKVHHQAKIGNIAGDIPNLPFCRSIRFSIEQHDDGPFSYVVMSAEEHTRCTDEEIIQFMAFARFVPVRENTPKVIPSTRWFYLLQMTAGDAERARLRLEQDYITVRELWKERGT